MRSKRNCHKEAQKIYAATRIFTAPIGARNFGRSAEDPFRAFLGLRSYLVWVGLVLLGMVAAPPMFAQRIDISWPTPNTAWGSAFHAS